MLSFYEEGNISFLPSFGLVLSIKNNIDLESSVINASRANFAASYLAAIFLGSFKNITINY